MTKTVIFGFDGTLLDTLDDMKTAVNTALEKLGYPTRSRRQLLRGVHAGTRSFISRALPRQIQSSAFMNDSLLSLFNTYYEKDHTTQTHPYEGLEDVLLQLCKRARLAVLSGKEDAIAKELIDRFYDKKIFWDVRGLTPDSPKSDATRAQILAKEMNAKPRQCIFVGDSDFDMQTAGKAGMIALGVTWGYGDEAALWNAKADYVAHSPEELISIIDSIEFRPRKFRLRKKDKENATETDSAKDKKKTITKKKEDRK